MPDFKKKLFINIGVSLGIIGLLFIGLIYFGNDIGSLSAKVGAERSDLALRSQLTDSLSLLRSTSQKAKPYSAQVDNLLPTRDRLVNFPRDLNAIASQNKVGLGFSFGQESLEKAGELNTLDFKITADGNLNDLVGMMRTLENSGYFTKINVLDFTVGGKGFTAQLGGEIFYR